MRDLLFSACFLILLTASANAQSTDNDSFRLTGKLSRQDTGTIIFSYETRQGFIRQTARLDNGTYRFAGKLEEPTVAHLTVHGQHFFLKDVFLENADIRLEDGHIAGPPETEEYDSVQQQLDSIQQAGSELFRKLSKSGMRKDTGFNNRYAAASAPIFARVPIILKTHIRENPDSWVSLTLLYNMRNVADLKEQQTLFAGLSPRVKQTQKARDFDLMLQSKLSTGKGTKAKDFTLPDTDNKSVSLRSYQGAYVLVDFWASWCGPCRVENPNVVKAYNTYKNKGFTVLGISLDNDRKSWLAAIQKDSLPWTQLCDLKGIRGQVVLDYGVSQIPASFLLDPRGTIIATNLRGNELQERLSQLLDRP